MMIHQWIYIGAFPPLNFSGPMAVAIPKEFFSEAAAARRWPPGLWIQLIQP